MVVVARVVVTNAQYDFGSYYMRYWTVPDYDDPQAYPYQWIISGEKGIPPLLPLPLPPPPSL